MNKAHQLFWNSWAESYQDFSELIEPYRDAQRDLAQATIAALGGGIQRKRFHLMDVGGGAGNMLAPLLDELAAKRGNLDGVSYTLTDSSETMLSIAQKRLDGFKKTYPQVAFRILAGNTFDKNFAEELKLEPADIVICSWNIEYYPYEKREEMVALLVDLANQQGIVAFSSTLRLPTGMKLRQILMPLGRAQVFHALLTGGPAKMGKVINSLKKITQFGTAISSQHFPEKPTLAELDNLVRKTGLYSVSTGYHLYGASAMVIINEDGSKLPPLPKLPIAQALAGKDGYQDYPETVSFGGYLKMLFSRRANRK